MARPKKAETGSPFVPVISRCARLVRLSYPNPDPRQKGNVSLTIVPGANFVPAEQAALCGIGHPDLDPFGGMPNVTVADPSSLDEWSALSTANISGNRKALKIWQASETRPHVKAAISARLNGKRGVEDDTADEAPEGVLTVH